MGMKFNKDLLALEQNNYASKILNVQIEYVLNAQPRNSTDSSKFKNCFFATSVAENSDKEKHAYTGYGITIDSAGSGNVNNDTVINVIIFGIDNSSSSHADNRKNNSLIPGDGPTLELMEILVYHRKNLIFIYFA